MKNLLKKTAVVVSLSTMMVVTFAGCAKKTECEMCGETKKCYEYTMSYEGQTESGYLCDDCYKQSKALVELVGGSIKKK